MRRSTDFHLRERVYTDDNPGYPNLRVRNSGFLYARCTAGSGRPPHRRTDRVRTEAFTATIGSPAGDENGEPTLTLHA